MCIKFGDRSFNPFKLSRGNHIFIQTDRQTETIAIPSLSTRWAWPHPGVSPWHADNRSAWQWTAMCAIGLDLRRRHVAEYGTIVNVRFHINSEQSHTVNTDDFLRLASVAALRCGNPPPRSQTGGILPSLPRLLVCKNASLQAVSSLRALSPGGGLGLRLRG